MNTETVIIFNVYKITIKRQSLQKFNNKDRECQDLNIINNLDDILE